MVNLHWNNTKRSTMKIVHQQHLTCSGPFFFGSRKIFNFYLDYLSFLIIIIPIYYCIQIIFTQEKKLSEKKIIISEFYFCFPNFALRKRYKIVFFCACWELYVPFRNISVQICVDSIFPNVSIVIEEKEKEEGKRNIRVSVFLSIERICKFVILKCVISVPFVEIDNNKMNEYLFVV